MKTDSLKIPLKPKYILQLDDCLALIDYIHKKTLYRGEPLSQVYFHSILTRASDYVRGFKQLITEDNYMSCGVLLRCHLDNLLKVYAFTIVENKEDFFNRIMSGEQISKMKLANGTLLREKFLYEEVSKAHPWVSNVYNKTSGFIHFGKSHIVACNKFIETDEKMNVVLLFGKENRITDKMRIEAIECIVDITKCIIDIIKKNSPEI